ncbi:hypothetical protein CSB37_04215 [bacterium DOLZORAL124_38_8]|nr:MAG: hypothetical protein CSB37_04215 [bacterium DOLZORAL124_38_8]
MLDREPIFNSEESSHELSLAEHELSPAKEVEKFQSQIWNKVDDVLDGTLTFYRYRMPLLKEALVKVLQSLQGGGDRNSRLYKKELIKEIKKINPNFRLSEFKKNPEIKNSMSIEYKKNLFENTPAEGIYEALLSVSENNKNEALFTAVAYLDNPEKIKAFYEKYKESYGNKSWAESNVKHVASSYYGFENSDLWWDTLGFSNE